jgi:hypothetical protein
MVRRGRRLDSATERDGCALSRRSAIYSVARGVVARATSFWNEPAIAGSQRANVEITSHEADLRSSSRVDVALAPPTARGAGADERPEPQRAWRRVLARTVVSARSAERRRRRASDVVVLVGSCVLLVVIALRARPATGAEVDLADFLNQFVPVAGVTLALRFGSLWVVGLVAGLGALARRWRLSLELLIAGAAAWSLGRALAGWYGRQLPPPGIIVRTGGLQEFPLVRIAVAVAVVSTAAP